MSFTLCAAGYVEEDVFARRFQDFIWNLPQGTREASLTIKTQDLVPTNIYNFNLKTTNATLY